MGKQKESRSASRCKYSCTSRMSGIESGRHKKKEVWPQNRKGESKKYEELAQGFAVRGLNKQLIVGERYAHHLHDHVHQIQRQLPGSRPAQHWMKQHFVKKVTECECAT